jgi:hypothetical protein
VRSSQVSRRRRPAATEAAPLPTKARQAFFSEAKKQKTFIRLSRLYPAARAKEQKFFGSFFQKRTALPG